MSARLIPCELAPDELANTLDALEEYLTQLQLASEPDEDRPDIIASVESALIRLDGAGSGFFGARWPQLEVIRRRG